MHVPGGQLRERVCVCVCACEKREMCDFAGSTQWRFWLFGEGQGDEIGREKLLECRLGANHRAQERLLQLQQRRKEAGSSSGEGKKKDRDISRYFLQPEDELLLEQFFASRIRALAEHLELPVHVEATAITFFKRFFLRNSFMEHDPVKITMASLYLACKAEENYLSVRDFLQLFSKATNETISVEDILLQEMTLLEGIGFHLQIHHPFRFLRAFRVKDSQHTIPSEVWNEAHNFLRNSLTMDAQFLYTPLEIATASMHDTLQNMGVNTLDSVLPEAAALGESRLRAVAASMRNTIQDLEAKQRSVGKSFRRIQKLVAPLLEFDVVTKQQEADRKRHEKLQERSERERLEDAETLGMPLQELK